MTYDKQYEMHANVDTDRRPLVLVWELTRACELTCKHCRADAQPDRHPDELTTAEGTALVNEARRFGENQLVVLSGGDPLARDDTVELIEYGADRGLLMTLTPSGTASLTPDRVAAVPDAGARRLAVSIDGGSRAANDEFRGEPGSFESTIRAAEAARDAGLPLQINTTVCAETADELPAIRDLVAELGAVLWSVFFLVPIGRGSVLDAIDPERAEDVMVWLADVEAGEGFGVKTTEAPHYRRVALQRRHEGGAAAADAIGRRSGITAGDGFAFVSHVGDVFPSGFLPESALFADLHDSDALRGKCGACEYRGVCGGSRSRAYATTGDPLASNPPCAYVPEGYEGPHPTAGD